MTKRIIGLVLALCLIVGLLPMIALAEENEITSTLAITTGTKDAKIQWKPTLAEGMTPAYAKTTAEGALVLDGATETDYNLKVEWETGKSPVLTMKGATLVNENIYPNKVDTIVIGGTEAFIVNLEGTNTILGNPSNEDKTVSAYRGPTGIEATNAGTLTIKGATKADTLTIDNKSGTVISKSKNDLIIETATVNVITFNSGSSGVNAQHAIQVLGSNAGFTVRNAKLDVTVGGYHGNFALLLSSESYKTDAAKLNANAGDILFQNSEIRMYRSNGTGSTQAGSALIQFGTNSTFTIDRCDALINSRHIISRYAPAIKNGTGVIKTEGVAEEKAWSYEAGANISTTKLTRLTVTHTCGTATDDFDCTTPNACDMCGTALGTAQSAHTPAEDDGDCTTAVMCANTGCNQIATPAQAAHTPEADDGDCTTAIKCSICGTETTAAAATHTAPADRTSCDQPANCTVCNKALAVGEHTGGQATCQAKANCAVCGQAYGEIGTHAGGTATCTEKAKCDTCNEPYGETAPHTEGTPATCKDQAVCSVCNQKYGELSTVHVPGEDDKDCTTAVACTVCGGEAIAAKTHAFTNSIDTACDNIGCEHTRVVEPKPDFKISFATKKGGGVPSSTGSATLVMKAGDPAKYYISGNFDTTAPKDYFCKELTDAAEIAAGNWNMMIEYPADGIPTVTIKKLFIQNKGALQFGGWYAPYEGPAKLIIAEDSVINSQYGYKGTLRFTTSGQEDDVTITSLNNAKLTLVSNTHAATEGAIKTNGNLLLDNANIEIVMTEYNGVASGVYVEGGNMTIKGGSLSIHAWDSSVMGTNKEGEEANYLLNANAAYCGFRIKKDANNETKTGSLTIEGGAKVYAAVSVCKADVDPDKRLVATDGVFTIKDSEVEIGLIGRCVDGAKLFLAKPVLEFTDNAYTITATKTKKPTVETTDHELDQYARYVKMTPAEDKLVNWAETTSLGSITYFKVVTGGTGGSTGFENETGNGGNTGTGGNTGDNTGNTGTGGNTGDNTGNTGNGGNTGTGGNTGNGGNTDNGGNTNNPNTGDVSILLTAAIALSSAVGFAGVTVLRKKEN